MFLFLFSHHPDPPINIDFFQSLIVSFYGSYCFSKDHILSISILSILYRAIYFRISMMNISFKVEVNNLADFQPDK